ncbi:hypothetical protein DOY81_008380 [Sarcophaga bullata]|nr:hypothetical protein DOY81_008380 [Sarcophaga bullata]
MYSRMTQKLDETPSRKEIAKKNLFNFFSSFIYKSQFDIQIPLKTING